MPPTTDETTPAAGTLVDKPADTKLEPPAATQPDDNVALENALDAALAADEEALLVSGASDKEVADAQAALDAAQAKATADIDAANQRAKQAREAATGQWQEFYTRLKDRARRSPVRGGPISNLLTMLLVAVALSVLVGCGASPVELANLKSQVRHNEQRLHDLEVLDGKIAAAAVGELRVALDKQTAQLVEAIHEVGSPCHCASPCPCGQASATAGRSSTQEIVLPMPEELPPPAKKAKAKGSSRSSPCLE